jgi:L-malate glycosyltransferase
MLGPVGSLHVEHMARAVHDEGYEVVVGGPLWPGASDSSLLDQPMAVSVRTWPTARWMRRLLRETRPDVVHAHWMPIAGLALLYGASPLVASAWGSDVFASTRSQRMAWRLVVRHADMVIGSSAELLGKLEGLGAPPGRSVLLNWGVDLEAFSPSQRGRDAVRRSLGLPAGPMILSPRSNGDVYNVEIILRAFDRLAAERSDVTLVLLRVENGDRVLPQPRYPDRVRSVGSVPYAMMADYYRAADVCVSIASTDSSPRSVWEAMSCGTPCVVSDIPWVHELIVHEEHALVVPIEEEAVALAMRRCLDDRTFAARVSANARRLVQKHRNRDRETERLCALYERVAQEGGRHARVRRVLGPAAALVGIVQAVVMRVLARHGRRDDGGLL